VKIFIVDDSELNRRLLIETMKSAGIKNEILEAADGKVAMDLLENESENICLLFLDWQLPRIDGLEILKRMARNPKTESLPIIMLTSATSPESEEIAHLLNPNLKAFILKPLDPKKIIEIALPHIK